MIREDDPRIEATHQAIKTCWDRIGPSDRDVLTYLVNPMFTGKPAWPNTRQAYRVVRPAGSLIIASDGLADPFVGTDQEDTSGFGMEVFIETPDLVGAGFQALRDSWAFPVIENFAMNVASWGGIAPQLRKYGVMSTEFPSEGMLPPEWLNAEGAAGFLVNMPVPGRCLEIADAPFGPVLLVPLTLLRPAELAFLAAGGPEARQEVVARLTAAGTGHRSSLGRASTV